MVLGCFWRALDLQPEAREIPSVVVSLRAPWLEFPVASFVKSMARVYEEGVLNGVFRQMPTTAWQANLTYDCVASHTTAPH